MYSPISMKRTFTSLALLMVMSSNQSKHSANAYLSSSSSSSSASLNKDFEIELQKTIENIRSYLSLEQRPKYFLRGAEQLCTEIDLGTDFFSQGAMDEAKALDDIVKTKPKELDFSSGILLTKEIDERCKSLGGSSFAVTFEPDEECFGNDNADYDGEREGCKNMITIKNFPICLANCICADVAAAKMSDKVTIVRTNGELNNVEKKKGEVIGDADVSAEGGSDDDADLDFKDRSSPNSGLVESDAGLSSNNTGTSSISSSSASSSASASASASARMRINAKEDAPILRSTGRTVTSSSSIITGNLVLSVAATVFVFLSMIA